MPESIREAGSFKWTASAAFGAVAMALVACGYLYYRKDAAHIRTEKFESLQAIGELKAREIGRWRLERIYDINRMAKSEAMIGETAALLRAPGDQEARRELRRRLGVELEAEAYSDALTVGLDGSLLLAAKDEPDPLDPATKSSIAAALASRAAVFSIPYRCREGVEHIDIAQPILAEDGRPVAVAVLRSDAATYLLPLIQAWPSPSRTAETLLVRRSGDEVVYLNDLRHQPHTALLLREPLTRTEIPSVQAVLGKKGLFEGQDYRGVEVLADLRQVPGSDWFLVAKLDSSELLAEAHSRGRMIAILIALGVLLAGAAVALVSRQRQAGLLCELLDSERSRAKAEERFRTIFEQASDGMFVADAGGRYTEVNPSGCAMLGYSREELLATGISDLVAPEDQATTPLRFAELRQGKTVRSERNLVRKDGSRLLVELSARLLADGGFQSIARDITERKQAEAALRESEENFRTIFESSSAAMAIIERDTTISMVNAEYRNIGRFSEADVIGKSWTRQIVPEDQERLKEYNRKRLTDPKSAPGHYEFRFIRKDGEIREALMSVSTIPTSRKIVCSFVDITERKRTEDSLRSSEARFRALYESMMDGFVQVDLDGSIVDFNRAYQEMVGHPPEKLRTLRYQELTPEKWHAAEAEIVETQLMKRGYTDVYEKEYRRADGTIFPVELRAALVRDHQGAPATTWGIVRDITARKGMESELRKTLDNLGRSNRDLEQFAYVASHDLQEPLRMVSSYTQLLAQRYQGQLDDKAKMYIGFAVDAAVRMQRLINDLLTYSRVSTKGSRPEQTDSHSVLGEVLRNLQLAVEESHAIVTNDDLPMVPADPAQLQQLLQNLVANGIKFHGPHAPHVHVSARDSGPEWQFSVKDNGIGIDPHYSKRLFVIFQRLHTREEYPGTGIGLALCKRIVERHGGRIWVESAPGQGSTFFFTLPKQRGNQ